MRQLEALDRMKSTPRTLLKKATGPEVMSGVPLAHSLGVGGAPPTTKVGFMSPKTAMKGMARDSPAQGGQQGQQAPHTPMNKILSGRGVDSVRDGMAPPLSPKPLQYLPEPKAGSSWLGGLMDLMYFLVEHVLLVTNYFLAFSIAVCGVVLALRFKVLLL